MPAAARLRRRVGPKLEQQKPLHIFATRSLFKQICIHVCVGKYCLNFIKKIFKLNLFDSYKQFKALVLKKKIKQFITRVKI